MISRASGTAAVLLLAATAAGCSSGDDAGTEPLAVTERAAAVSKVASTSVVHWSATLTNPNKGHFGEYPVAKIIATDKEGEVLAEREEPLNVVPPGGRVAATGHLSVQGEPADVEVTYEDASWLPATRKHSSYLDMPVTDTSFDKIRGDGYRVSGKVANPYNHPIEGLAVTALLRGADGALVGGGTTHLDHVAGGVDRPFTVTVEAVKPGSKVKNVEVIPTTWGASHTHLEDLAGSGPFLPPPAELEGEPFTYDRAKGYAIDSAAAGRED